MIEEANPYAAPQADLTTVSGSGALASPWLRLAAAFIDGIVLFPINWILQKIFLHTPDTAALIEAAQKGPEAMQALMPGRGMLLFSQLLGLAVFIGVNWVFLKKGQSIGKMAMKLQIQDRLSDTLLPVQDLIVKRVLPVYLVAAIGVAIHPIFNLILLVDSLCIFRAGHNTLHDDLAKTKVVKLPGA